MTAADLKPTLDDAQRSRLAAFADALIPGGAGLPSASAAKVHQKWIDRVLAARPDLGELVLQVIAGETEPRAELEQLRQLDPDRFERFTFAVSGAYFINPRVRKLLGYPGSAPKKKPAYPDEAEHYLEDGILDPVIARGPIYRPTPPTA
jgi:hypothetical protein